MPLAIVIHAKDNVATALEEIPAGVLTTLKCSGSTRQGPVAAVRIPFGHKLAVGAITRGDEIVKYGEVIGEASQDILPGEHVHVHNVSSKRGRGDLDAARHR